MEEHDNERKKITIEEKLLKEWFQEAMTKWLDQQKKEAYQSVGQWIAQTVSYLFIAACVYLILWANGFKRT